MVRHDIGKYVADLGILPKKIEIKLHEKPQSELSDLMKNFAHSLADLSEGQITVTENGGEEDRLPERPALSLGGAGLRNIHYLGLPEHNELAPFMKALKFTSAGEAPLTSEVRAALDEVSSPADIWIFVSGFCTNCPKVVETVAALATYQPKISLFIIDVQHFNELADGFGVKSVPATVIDHELVLAGQVEAGKLVSLLGDRGTSRYERELVRSWIDGARPSKAAEYVGEGKGGEALVELFQEPELSTRMGVLVVLEEALAKFPDAVMGLVLCLLPLLSHEDARIRGDMADFLGNVGDPSVIPHLEKLTEDSDPDVVEAAEDALEALRGI